MAWYKRFCFLPLLISQIVLQGLARSWQARLPEAGRIKQSCKVSKIPNDQEHRPCGDLALKVKFFKQSCKVSRIPNDQEHRPCGDLAFKVTRWIRCKLLPLPLLCVVKCNIYNFQTSKQSLKLRHSCSFNSWQPKVDNELWESTSIMVW